MTEDSEKLLFRMQHIIPQGLSSEAAINQIATINNSATFNGPEEFVMQMAFGKIAGM